MTFLVATAKKILEVDFSRKCIQKVIHQGCGAYFGIEKNKGEYYFGVRNHDNNGRYGGSILICDQELEAIGQITPASQGAKLDDINQIRFFRDKLYVTCTIGDKIVIIDKNNDKNCEVWQPMPLEGIPLTSGHPNNLLHINTLASHDGYLFVGCNGHQHGSQVHQFDKNLECIKKWKIGEQIHEIFFVDDILHVLSSKTKTIIRSPDEVLCTINYKDFSIYPRGFISTEDSYYVGLSYFDLNRHARESKNSHILQYDKQWNLIDEMMLEDTGNFHDMELR